MKYTRYDMKPKKKNDDWKTTIMMILAVVVLALLIGSLIFFQMFPVNEKTKPKDKTTQTEEKKPTEDPSEEIEVPPVVAEEKEEDEKEQTESASTTEATTYTVVQCGYFSKKESADAVKEKIGESAKILTEGDKFRVVCYIGSEAEAKKLLDEFTKKEIENTKVRFNLPGETVTDKAIIEMVNGILDITVKLNEADVASVKSDKFKTWASTLTEVTDDAKLSNFIAMKKMINELPVEITSKEIEKIYQTIYNVVSSYK